MKKEQLQLYVLKGGGADATRLMILACRGPDIALHEVRTDSPEIASFVAFRERVENVVLGGTRPATDELEDLGNRMFQFFFAGPVRELYDRLPAGAVSVQVATDAPEVQRIPWEYMRPVNRTPVPHPERCVVRVVPMCARSDPKPAKARSKFKVLLAVADPVNEPGVGWADVEANVRRAFDAQTSVAAELTVVPGATAQGLLQELNTHRYDVFHFLGHGGLIGGKGQLALIDVETRKSDLLDGRDLALTLSGRGLRLCILSACLTSAGDLQDDFGPIATALLRAGIPAVVANQTSIPTKSVAPFLAQLYLTLLRDGDIDAAVMQARVALHIDLRNKVEPGKAVVEWGIPTLYRLPGAAQVFQPAPEGP